MFDKNSSKVTLPGMGEVVDIFEQLERRKELEKAGVIAQRVYVPISKIEQAIAFWKPIYLSVTAEGRHLNGVEAYDLGDEKKTPQPNKDPYIAMCNLMVLEYVKRMGETYPTVEQPHQMVFGSQQEQEIAQFWKDTFAPTLFQSEWALTTGLSLLCGEPHATREILVNYRDQLS